jgi:hypothetical protein
LRHTRLPQFGALSLLIVLFALAGVTGTARAQTPAPTPQGDSGNAAQDELVHLNLGCATGKFYYAQVGRKLRITLSLKGKVPKGHKVRVSYHVRIYSQPEGQPVDVLVSTTRTRTFSGPSRFSVGIPNGAGRATLAVHRQYWLDWSASCTDSAAPNTGANQEADTDKLLPT